MKKVILIAFLSLNFVSCQLSNPEQKKEPLALDSTIIAKINSFEKAEISKQKVNEISASEFPGTLVFVFQKENKSLIVLNSLPNLYKGYDAEIYSKMQHGNMSIIESDEGIFGLIPKHVFVGLNEDLVLSLKAKGLKPNPNEDIITFTLPKKIQKTLTCKLFDNLEPERLEATPCILKTLNCFDSSIYQYKIKGVLHYLSPEEQELIFKNALNSLGQKAEAVNTKGLYVVSVPNDIFDEILGMSGGSCTVNIDGEDYFLGINTNRLVTLSTNGKDTIMNTLMVIQPVLSSDL